MFTFIRNAVIVGIRYFNKDIQINGEDILIDQPKDKFLGDVYTNVAMLYAKKIGTTPQKLAEEISKLLLKNPNVQSIRIDGPGFLNIKIKNDFWQSMICNIIRLGRNFSVTPIHKHEKLNIEFVSANPTGPLHTGHARNAVFGSVCANLLEKVGYDVTREFYINDQGNQIKHLARSVYLRYIELLGKEISEDQFTSDMYCGSYIKDVAKDAIDKFGSKFLDKTENEWLKPLCEFSIKYMLDSIKKDLYDVGVVMDVYTSEKEVCSRNLVDKALEILKERGDIYEGILPKPKGTVAEDWEERPQTLFKSTKYGDEIDRAIKKSDGTWTYFAGDLAYHLDKFQRGFTHMLNIFGADHNGYVKRLKSAVYAISDGKADLEVRLYQLVNFLENGVPVRMSKRKGNFITLRDVIERVGKDVTRFMMVSRHHDVMIDFDFKKAVEFSMDNPLFYIQYAHARICSVFRNFNALFGKQADEKLYNADLSLLVDDAELDLIKALTFWKERIKLSAKAIEPHRVPTHLRDICALFHSLWNKGKSDDHLRFINKENMNLTFARMTLLRVTQIVIQDGLSILGITPMEEMKPLNDEEINETHGTAIPTEKNKDNEERDIKLEKKLDKPFFGIALPEDSFEFVSSFNKKNNK